MRACYNTLKYNAKRRGKQFDISFEYFMKFCIETNYISGKGKTKESYSIDRIDNNLGYIEGNLQILTLGDNTRKRVNTLHYDWEQKQAYVTNNKPISSQEDNYF